MSMSSNTMGPWHCAPKLLVNQQKGKEKRTVNAGKDGFEDQ
jgi:hypothetical protein